jgi:hypothetical protein
MIKKYVNVSIKVFKTNVSWRFVQAIGVGSNHVVKEVPVTLAEAKS